MENEKHLQSNIDEQGNVLYLDKARLTAKRWAFPPTKITPTA